MAGRIITPTPKMSPPNVMNVFSYMAKGIKVADEIRVNQLT